MSNPEKYISVTLIRSPVGRLPRHKSTLATMGLKRLHQTVTLKANAATAGMVRQVRYLLQVTLHDVSEGLS